MLNVVSTKQLNNDVRKAYEEYVSIKDKHRLQTSGARSIDETIILSRGNYVTKSKRSVTELSDRSQHCRLSDFVGSTKKRAEEEGVSPTKLYAFGLKSKYLKNKGVADIGKNLFNDDESNVNHTHVPLQTASAIFVRGKMTKHVYTEIRLLSKEAGADVLPTYDALDYFRIEHRPEVKELQPPFVGVKFDYEKALELTAAQLFKSINLPVFKI